VPVTFTRQKVRAPDIFLRELLKKYMQGRLRETSDFPQFLLRATVLAVDVDGGVLENPTGAGAYDAVVDGRQTKLKASIGPANPPNSLKCRLITDGLDRLQKDSDVGVFWPLLGEHMSSPAKVGEHVYVTFEDQYRVHGLWLCRVSGHVGANVVIGAQQLKPSEPNDANSNFDDGEEPARVTDSQLSARPKDSDDLNGLFEDPEEDV
jgi:hypothetical protein